MKIAKIFTPAIALALLISTAQAGVLGFDTEQSPAEAACPGCIANDLLINFEGNLRGQQLYLQLDSGEVYNQTTFGTDTAPNPALFPVDAAIEFDSFLTIGGLDSSTSEGVLVVGGAVDIPGAPGDLAIGPQTISAAWAPATGTDVPNGNRYPVARITLSPDANGNAWIFSSTSGNDPPFLESRLVIDGRILPEPTSMALAGLSLIGFVAMRRRS